MFHPATMEESCLKDGNVVVNFTFAISYLSNLARFGGRKLFLKKAFERYSSTSFGSAFIALVRLGNGKSIVEIFWCVSS